MKSVGFYAKLLKIISIFLVIPTIIFSFYYKWFLGSGIEAVLKKHDFWCGVSYTFDSNILSPVPMISKILALLVDGFSYIIFILGFIYFIKILNYYQQGKIFSEQTFLAFKWISRLAFLRAIYTPIKYSLLSIITTFHNPVGQRVLSATIGSDDIFNIFIVGFFLLITSIMYEGYKIKKEVDQTI
jgi:hypothetical protein